MKIICGLGNPGPEYEATRHNIGWWAVDRLCADWRSGPFRREGRSLVADGRVGDEAVVLLKPLTYMNRSGAALAPFGGERDVDLTEDLLVVVDDAALDVGRLRIRARGSAGGHNGLKSIEAALGTRDYARMRIGVGSPPRGVDMMDWVLSPFPPDDEDAVLAVLATTTEAVETWIAEGVETAMNRYN